MSTSGEDIAVKTTYLSIFSSIILVSVKWISGVLGHSYALIADAIESLTDVVSSLFILFGLKYSSKPADANHPYGHGRIESLVTFVVVGMLILSAGLIAHNSVENILTPHELPAPWTLIVLGVIILWKEISYRIIIRRSKITHSSSLKAEAWHHRSDAITSVTAFAGISFALYMGKGYESADDWAALLACVFILYNSFQIFRPALSELMDEHLYHDLSDEIRTISKTVEGVVDIEKCFIRKSGLRYHVDLHLEVDGDISVRKGHEIAHTLQDKLHEDIPNLGHISVHVEPDDNPFKVDQ